MKSEDFTTSKQAISLEVINCDITKVISQNIFITKLPDFDIKTGVFKVLADHDPKLNEFFDSVNNILQIYLLNNPFNTGPKNCPKCGDGDIRPHGAYSKNIQESIGLIELMVQRYMCKKCKTTFSIGPDDQLTPWECHYSMDISRLMVVLYTGGCSLRFTADIINSSMGTCVNHNTVRNHVLRSGKEIREDFKDDITKKSIEIGRAHV